MSADDGSWVSGFQIVFPAVSLTGHHLSIVPELYGVFCSAICATAMRPQPCSSNCQCKTGNLIKREMSYKGITYGAFTLRRQKRQARGGLVLRCGNAGRLRPPAKASSKCAVPAAGSMRDTDSPLFSAEVVTAELCLATDKMHPRMP